MNKICIGYARESRKKHSNHGKNIMREQKYIIKNYCKNNNIKLIGIICETITGRNNDFYTRPKLQEALEYLYNGEANTLITSDVDRLTRNTDFIDDFINFILNRFNYIAVCDNINISNYNNIHKLKKKVKFAENEGKAISYRCKRSVDDRKRNNLYNGGRLKYGTGKLQNGKLYMIKNEQDIIKLMFYLRDVIGLSYSKLAEYLNSSGYRTHYGKLFNKGTINRQMRNVEKTNEFSLLN